MSGLNVDILARIASDRKVTFWRKLRVGETVSNSETFETSSEWVEITNGKFSTDVGGRALTRWIQVSMTAFYAPGVSGIPIGGAYTVGGNSSWTEVPNSTSSSTTFVSPNYSVPPSPVEIRVGLRVGAGGIEHEVDLELSAVLYSPNDPKPPKDILIGDIPEPDPSPVGMDVLIAPGIPRFPSFGPIDTLVSIARRSPLLFDGPIVDEFVSFLESRALKAGKPDAVAGKKAAVDIAKAGK